MRERASLVIVGAGPAGLAAAVAAVEGGQSGIMLVDAGAQPGGQCWRHPDEGVHPLQANGPTGSHDWAVFVDLRRRLDAAITAGRVRVVAGQHVTLAVRDDAGFRLVLTPGSVSASSLVADQLILCPGAYDRQVPLPGWDLPGVFAAGGVQALLKAHGVAPGSRAVVAGTGVFLLSVAATLVDAGVQVAAVVEANWPTRWLPHLPAALTMGAKLGEGAAYAATLARHRVPYLLGSRIKQIHGDARAEAVTIKGPARQLTRVDADLVALGWGFTPQTELVLQLGAATLVDADGSLVARVDADQATDVPGLYVAGEATGVGGAIKALLEGALAGAAASGRPVAPTDPRRRELARQRRFGAALARAYPVPDPALLITPDTIVCRCEEVPWRQVRAAVVAGAHDLVSVKSQTRCGMGWCQGRMCGYAVNRLAAVDWPPTHDAVAGATKRPFAAPLTLGELADLRADLEADLEGAS